MLHQPPPVETFSVRLSTTFLSAHHKVSKIYDPVFRVAKTPSSSQTLFEALNAILTTEEDQAQFQTRVREFCSMQAEKSRELTSACNLAALTRMHYRVAVGCKRQEILELLKASFPTNNSTSSSPIHAKKASFDEVISLLVKRNAQLQAIPRLNQDLRHMRRHLVLRPYSLDINSNYALAVAETLILSRFAPCYLIVIELRIST